MRKLCKNGEILTGVRDFVKRRLNLVAFDHPRENY